MRGRWLRLWVWLGVLGAGAVLAGWCEGPFTTFTVRAVTFIRSGTIRMQPLDSLGVPEVFYRRSGRTDVNPAYVGIYGLRYQRACGGDDADLSAYAPDYTLDPLPPGPAKDQCVRFLHAADWLREHAVARRTGTRTFLVWTYDFPWPANGMPAGWVSGMAQGLAIQVLVRAWRMTGDSAYLRTAEGARDAFTVPIDSGGVMVADSAGTRWYEEYAAAGVRPPLVLNGMEHALLGLHDLATLAGDSTSAGLFRDGVGSVERHLPGFDRGWWTAYDLAGTMANLKYHRVNISLTRLVGQLAGSAPLLRAADRWAGYRTPFLIREFVRQRPQVTDVAVLLLGEAPGLLLLGCLSLRWRRRRG